VAPSRLDEDDVEDPRDELAALGQVHGLPLHAELADGLERMEVVAGAKPRDLGAGRAELGLTRLEAAKKRLCPEHALQPWTVAVRAGRCFGLAEPTFSGLKRRSRRPPSPAHRLSLTGPPVVIETPDW
jgi:hypothetical protein